MERKWSEYSLKLYSTFIDSNENIIVYACPGAGKTTNIEHIWSLDNKPTVYTVFNKHNQLEALEKLPAKVNSAILTLNGLGAGIVNATFGRVTLDKYKVPNLIKAMASYRTGRSKESRERQYILSNMVSIAKCVDVGMGFNEEMYDSVVAMYDIDEYPTLYQETVDILERSDSITGVIDFQDQLRFPVIYDCAMPQYHNVLGDEVQDFNPVQAALIARLKAQRYVLVGDSHQSIYGFRGAMCNSMQVLREQFNCTELPLSITYRCAKDIVTEASNIYKDIEPWEDSPQGVVRYSSGEGEQYSSDDIILCRMNRPLIALAYQLLNTNTPCHVRGRDIGEGLVKLINKQGCITVRELIVRLNEEYTVEMETAGLKEDDDKMQRLEDKYGSALLFCNRAKLNDAPEVVVQCINALFEQGRGVCLSTVHKAKGLEARRAFILNHDLHSTFTQRARHQWQKEQERNILYVAVTRAKRELVYM